MVMQQEADDLKKQMARLGTFLKWLTVSVIATALLTIVLSFVNIESQGVWGAVSLLCYGGVLAVAYAHLRRQRMVRAVVIACVGLIVLGVANVFITALLFPIYLNLPIMALALALPYVNAVTLLRMSIIAVVATFVIIAAGLFLPGPVPSNPFAVQLTMLMVGTSGIALNAFLLWQFHNRLNDTLRQTQAMNTDLNRAQSDLEFQVADRTAELQFTLTQLEYRTEHQEQLLAELEQQRHVIRELSVPVLPVSANTLVMPLVGALDTQRLQDVQEQALASIERSHARRLLLDITGVPVVDSQVAQGLLHVVQAARLLGAEVQLIGVRPEVAQALVSLGANLPEVRTFSDLQTALMRERGVVSSRQV